jgi:hypothetical protein
MNSSRFFLSVANGAKEGAKSAAEAVCTSTLLGIATRRLGPFLWEREAIMFMVILIIWGAIGMVVGGIKGGLLHLCRNDQSEEVSAQLSM